MNAPYNNRMLGVLLLVIALVMVIKERIIEKISPKDFHNSLRDNMDHVDITLGARDEFTGSGRRRLLEFLNVETIGAAIKKKLPVLDTGLSFLDESAHHQTRVKNNKMYASNKQSNDGLSFLDSSDFTTTSISAKSVGDNVPVKTTVSAPRDLSQNNERLTFLDSIASHHKEKASSGGKVNIAFPGTNDAGKHHDQRNREDQPMTANEHDILQAHPYVSPRKGTDISPANQMAVLLCPNQSKCIVPELQLQKRLRVYFCKHPTRHGVRFYYLAREGLLLHPNVDLVTEEAIETADYIVYLPGSAPWHLTECNKPSYAKRLVVLDEFDGHSLFVPAATREDYIQIYGGPSVPWYYMYFKRSFVRRHDGVFQGYPHIVQRDVYPLTYSIAEAYIPHTFNHQREIEILCTLRGSKHMTTRLRAQEWVAEYGIARGIKNIVTSQVNSASRTTVSMQYFQQMYNSQIIVTVNPANWEGDFRLWESMCTGALVFVDPIFVPHPFPITDGVHVIFFSNSNKTELFDKLDYYRNHPIEAKKIAINGYLHAMKYHRTVNMMDYILRTVHMGNVSMNRHHVGPIPKYSFTGQYLNYEAKMQQEMILNCHQPGIFEPLEDKSGHVKRLTFCAK